MSPKPHSAAVLTDLRDRWWSTDFLELLVSRLGLKQFTRIADLGCGHGHWGQRLLPLLAESAVIFGLDQESAWIDKATTRARELGVEARCHYQVGTIERLPYEDQVFDLVTCQTLLMHVANVELALSEMFRVLRPGGRLLIVEPNNVAQQFVADSANRGLSPQQLANIFCLFTACSRGRDALGRGDDCVGDRLPSLLQEFHLEEISVVQNERTGCILPPYDSHDRAQLEQAISHADEGFWLWNKSDAQALYQAGGGDMARFEDNYAAFVLRTELFKQQVRAGSYWSNNASISYVISALRPASV